HGSSTDIVSDKLITVATDVNHQFGIDLNCFDIKLTWDKLRSLWETWVHATHYVPPEKANFSTGEINIDDFVWDQLVKIVPDAEIFRRKKMISPNMECTVFNRTPPLLAPEEFHLRDLKEAEEKEWEACMDMVNLIDALHNSREYNKFCMSLFKNREIRSLHNLCATIIWDLWINLATAVSSWLTNNGVLLSDVILISDCENLLDGDMPQRHAFI
ncbi:hypothetical protein SO802_017432, partial [Lithocarpus litseifolius]